MTPFEQAIGAARDAITSHASEQASLLEAQNAVSAVQAKATAAAKHLNAAMDALVSAAQEAKVPV